MPFSLVFAGLVCYHMTSRIGGHGSILLISLHAFGKLVQYFGIDLSSSSDYEGEYEPWNDETDTPTSSTPSEKLSTPKGEKQQGKIHRPSPSLPDTKSADDIQLLGKSNSGLRKRKKSISYNDLHLVNEKLTFDDHARLALANRGSELSSFVSVSLPSTVRAHWFTALSRRTLGFSLHLARSLTLTDSLLAGIMRVGTALGVIFTLLFGIISVLSVLQQNLNLFPKLLTYHSSHDSILINHIISNVTLYKNSMTYSPKDATALHEQIINLKKPMYASCSMRWKTLSILDFAILSELSYFDDPYESNNITSSPTGPTSPTIQSMLDELFPDLDFLQIKPPNTSVHQHERSGFEGAHPMYLEVKSDMLGLTIVAVRGTDVGRLHDFLGKFLILVLVVVIYFIEDVKLFAEPVLISLLSCIFPLMRVSSDTTISTIIQVLHESNSFFGLVGEAEYYQPLVERVRVISNSSLNDKTDVILTGHSLGGGLSRIVAALTHLPSVSFAPPGIALSHRKFSVLEEKSSSSSPLSTNRKIGGMTDLHDQSMAVITDFDM